MNIQSLTDKVRELIPTEMTWKFALYSTSKTRDGLELDFSLCNMEGTAEWVDKIRENLLKKQLNDRVVSEYSPMLPKDVIGAIEASDPLIRDRIGNIVSSINNALEYAPESFISGVVKKPVGYAFLGQTENENAAKEQVLFMRRTNPFLTNDKVRLCTSHSGKIYPTEIPILKFAPATDFLLIGGVCYFFSEGIEKDFELENRHMAICSRRLAELENIGLVNPFEQLEKLAMSPKQARKFLDYDEKLIEYIAGLPLLERMDYLSNYGIVTDNEGRMDASDPEQCELIIDLLCSRSCFDAFGRLSVGDRITPR